MKQARLWLLAVVLGVTNALVLEVFEWLVNNGTDFIWNDVFRTNSDRIVTIPLAIGLSLLFTLVLKLTKQPRLTSPKTDPSEAVPSSSKPTIKSILIISVVGLVSLLAGASLGPEASLMAIAGALGIWLAQRSHLNKNTEVLAAASVGALLVAFIGSLLLAALPLLELLQKKRLDVNKAIIVLLAGISSYLTVLLIEGEVSGYGTIPINHRWSVKDIVLAIVVGITASLVGFGLTKIITGASHITTYLDGKLPWFISASLFGLVIGILYWVGGQTIEFSGSSGSSMLVRGAATYSIFTLVIILVSKLLVTGWSLASGYRGGLVFPSIFMGVTVALLAEAAIGVSASSGVMIGAVAGILCALLGPAPAFIFIAALIPFKLVGIAAAGIIGAFIGKKLLTKLTTSRLTQAS